MSGGTERVFLEQDGQRWRVRVQEPRDSRALSSGFIYAGGDRPARFEPSSRQSFTAEQLRAIAAAMDSVNP